MTNDVVRIPLEPDVRKFPRHPRVERVMQEKVCQQRRFGQAEGGEHHCQPNGSTTQLSRTVCVQPMAASGVRRDKAALSSGCKAH